jgi:RHS repeat-associated protein
MSDSERENDTIPTRQGLLGSDDYDPNPRVGRVLLTHGPGIDQPLSVIRMGYREWEEGQLLWQAFAVVPLWDTQRRAPYMLFSNGARSLAPSFAPSGTRKLQTAWRLGRDAYGPANNAEVLPVKGTEPVWMGGVIADQQDASGLLYRRNRYYDPQTGRFTQEDPIGLAGGLNLYGFAEGDPVSCSDPYGLCPGRLNTNQFTIKDCPRGYFEAIGELFGATIGYDLGASIGAGGGAVLGGGCGPAALGLVCSPASAAAGSQLVRSVGAIGGTLAGGRLGRAVDQHVQRMANAGRGRGGNRVPNSDVNRLHRQHEINEEGQRHVHDQITGQDLKLDEIEDIVREAATHSKFRRTPPTPTN